MKIIKDIYPFNQIDPSVYTITVPKSWFVCEKNTFNRIKALLEHFPCVIVTSSDEEVFDLRYIDGILGNFNPQMFCETISPKLEDKWQVKLNEHYQTRFVVSTVGETSYAVAKRSKNAIPPHTDGLEYQCAEKFLSILHLCREEDEQSINYVVDMCYIAHFMAEKFPEEFNALSDPRRTNFLIPFTGQTQKHSVFSFNEKGFLEVYYHAPEWLELPKDDDVVCSGMHRIAELSYRDNLRIPISLKTNSVAILKNSHLHGRKAFCHDKKLTVITQHLGLPIVRVFNTETARREEFEGILPGIIPVSGSALEHMCLRSSKALFSSNINDRAVLYSTQSCNL